MLSKMIVTSYGKCIEVALWLSLLVCIVTGWRFPTGGAFSDKSAGLMGAIGGSVFWFIGAVVLFGAFLVLGDIRDSVRRIEAHLTSRN